MVLRSKWISFRDAEKVIPRDRLILLLENGVIDSRDRETGWPIPAVYWSKTGPPPPEPDANGWIPESIALVWPLDLDEVELLRAEVEALADPSAQSQALATENVPLTRPAAIDVALITHHDPEHPDWNAFCNEVRRLCHISSLKNGGFSKKGFSNPRLVKLARKELATQQPHPAGQIEPD